MNSIVLHTSSRIVLPVAVLFSLYVLFRGHNEPGGGFIGGLIAAAGYCVYALPRGREVLLKRLKISPETLIGSGLVLALLAGLPALAIGEPFLRQLWLAPAFGLGTTLVFDIGVYLAVLGAVLMLVALYMED
jgi:multicomponent Na+:H+ antiporter subunit B